MAEARRNVIEKLRDKAMSEMHEVRETTWNMIEMFPEKDRDKIADKFDKVFKALQRAVIEL